MEHSTVEGGTRKRRKRGAYLALLFGVPVVLIGVVWVVFQLRAGGRLGRAIAEADRLDPGWQLEALEAEHASIPRSENSALLVEAAAKALERQPKPASARTVSEESRDRTLASLVDAAMSEPSRRLDDAAATELRTDLAESHEALQELEALPGCPRGRFAVLPGSTFASVALVHVGFSRAVARLLVRQGTLRAHEEDIDGALESSRAVINTARAIGDEPALISQVARCANDEMACSLVQRALGQGEASEAALAKLQALLTREAREPLGLYAMRGERANSFFMMNELCAGRMPPGAVAGGATTASRAMALISQPYLRHNQAAALEMMNGAVEISKLPISRQIERWRAWEREQPIPVGPLARASSGLSAMLVPAVLATAKAFPRNHAQLEAAVTIVAAERYRMVHGGWPTTVDALIPRFLATPPIDPFTSAPLRIRPLEDGIAIYSVGPDGTDDGGTFDGRSSSGYDLGYRLWDVPERRRPPAMAELPVDVFQSAR